MQTRICKVVAQTEPMYVPSKKSENGQLAKCYVRLRELVGDYEESIESLKRFETALQTARGNVRFLKDFLLDF